MINIYTAPPFLQTPLIGVSLMTVIDQTSCTHVGPIEIDKIRAQV